MMNENRNWLLISGFIAIIVIALAIANAGAGTSPFPVDFSVNGTPVAQRSSVNIIDGSNVTVTAVDSGLVTGVEYTITSSGGGGGYSTIEDEDTPLTVETVLNFTGAGITCTAGASQTDCDVPSGAGGESLAATLGFGAVTGGTDITFDGAGDIVIFSRTQNLELDALAQTVGAGTAQVPDLAGTTDQFVLEDITQVITNKTINTASNTITVGEGDISDLGTLAAMVADNLSVFASTTSVQLDGIISNDVGFGALVFNDAPSINDIVLTGTPDAASSTWDNIGTIPLGTISGSLTWNDGVKQTFNPNGTNAGFSVGSHTAEPSVPIVGDIFYDSTAGEFKGYNGAWIDLGSAGSTPTLAAVLATGDTTGGNNIHINGATDVLRFTRTQFVDIQPVAQTVNTGNAHIPDLAGTTDVFVFEDIVQTVTNKTIAFGSNTITVDLTALDTQGAATDEFCLTVETGGGASIELQNCSGGGEALAATLGIGNTTGGNNIVMSGATDSIDFTRTQLLVLDALTQTVGTGIAQVPDLANTTDQFVLEDVTQVITNKTINTASNTITVGEGDISDLGTLAAMVADNLSVFAVTTSAQLAGVITNETGTGLLVYATDPILTTPNLGTPSAGTLTNADGLPIVGGTTGTLTEIRGGTGTATYTTGDILYSDASNSLAKLPIGTNTHVLTLTGGLPGWAAPTGGAGSLAATLVVGNSSGGTNLVITTGDFLAFDDGASAFELQFAEGDTLTADRTLTFDLGDGDRTFDLQGNLTVESASIIDQDLTADSATVAFANLDLTGTVNALTIPAAGEIRFDEVTFDLMIDADNQSGSDNIATIPDLGGSNRTFAFLNMTQFWNNQQEFSPATDPIVIGNANGEILFEEATFDLRLASADQTVGDGRAEVPDLESTTDEFVMVVLAQTLTNKTIEGSTNSIDFLALDTQGALTDENCLTYEGTSGSLIEIQPCGGSTPDLQTVCAVGCLTTNDLWLNNTGATLSMVTTGFSVLLDRRTQTVGSGTAYIPDLAGNNEEIITEDVAQTLTNKTIAFGSNTLTVDFTALDTQGALTDENCLTYEATGANIEVQSCGGGGADLATVLGVASITGGSDITFSGAGDTIQFTRTQTLVIDALTQTVGTGTAQIVDLAGSTDQFVMEDTTQTLTAKTLTSPTLTAPSISGAGSIDGGSFTSFEIENSGTLTLTVDGEIGIDTTDDQFQYRSGSATHVLVPIKTISFVLESPASADAFYFWKPVYDITVLGYDCIVDGGTSATLFVEEWSSTGVFQANLDSSAVICDTNGAADDGSLTNPTVDAGDWMVIDIVSESGTPNSVAVTIRYTVDAS